MSHDLNLNKKIFSIKRRSNFKLGPLEYSQGGFQEQDQQEEFYNYEHSMNIIATEDPFKMLVNTKRLEPYFDPNVNQNVTALVGKSAYLNCIVKNLGNKTVEFKT